MEAAGGAIGEVAVDVYADVTRLERDFNRARQTSEQFGRDLENKVGKSAQKAAASMASLDRATEQLAQSYSPLHAAQIRYAKDLEKIERLQKAQIFSQNDAAMFAEKATDAYRKAAREQSKAHQWAMKANEQIGRYGPLLLAAGAAAVVMAVRSSLQQAKAIKETSEELRISTKAYQEWLYVASQSGVSANEVATGFTNLEKAIGRASTGSRREAGLFKALGIELNDTSGKAKNADIIMRELADRLGQVGDANVKAAALQAMFGESANEMGKLLEGGSARINELSESAARLGVVLSDEQIQSADQTAQKLEDVKNVLAAQIAGVVAQNAGAIIGLANAFARLTTAIFEFWKSNPAGAMAITGTVSGAIVGGKIGGPKGAVVGAVVGTAGGWMAGRKEISDRNDASNNVAYQGKRLNTIREMRDKARANGSRNSSYEAAYNKQWEIYNRSLMAGQGGLLGKGNNVGTGNANGPDLSKAVSGALGPKPAKGGGSGSGRSPRDTSSRDARNRKAFEDALSNFEAQLLRMALDEVGNAEAKAGIQLKLLDIEKQKFETELAADGPGGTKRYSAAQVEQLRLKHAEVDMAKRAEIEAEKQETLRKEYTEIAESILENEAEILGMEKGLAKTQKKRREVSLELLDLQHKMEAAQLDGVIASKDSSDTEKEIARERKKHLEKLMGLQKEVILRETQGPVAQFFESIPKTADEIDEAIERIRAANLEGTRQRAVQFADDIGAAFGDLARSIVNLENPLDILKNLLTSLAQTFTEEVIVRPIQNWARERIGAPLAERVVGAPAGQEGLWQQQLAAAGLNAKMALDQLALSATRAGFGFGGAGGAGLGGAAKMDQITAIWDQDFESLVSGGVMGDFASAMTSSTAALKDQTSELGNFGMGLGQALAMMSSGGGGGGIMGAVLSIAGSALGGIGGGFSKATIAGITPSSMATVAANPGIFDEGGEVGPNGLPIKRQMKPGNRWIVAHVGETVIPPGPSRKFRPMLDAMRLGHLPDFGGAMMRMGSQTIDKGLYVNLGGITVQGALNKTDARRSAKQLAAGLQSELSKAAKQGIRHD